MICSDQRKDHARACLKSSFFPVDLRVVSETQIGANVVDQQGRAVIESITNDAFLFFNFLFYELLCLGAAYFTVCY
jgi:hypothetical protein